MGQNWSLETGWSIGDDVATCDGTNGVLMEQPLATVNTKLKKITFTVSNYVSGQLRVYSGAGADILYTVTANGTYTYYDYLLFNKISFYSASLFNGSVTNISVIEITDDTNLPRINYEGFSYQDALGSELVVNGTFDDGLNGWQPHVGSILELENGMAKVTVVGNQGFIRRNDLSIETGKTYFCKAYITNGTPPQWYINGTNNLLNLSLISEKYLWCVCNCYGK